MTISELSKYQKRRFCDNNKCKICNNEIKNQDFEMLPVKCGRLVNYSFFHTDCLLGNNRNP